MNILLVDNYDSFTFNLMHYLEAFDCNVTVIRHDVLDLNQVANHDKIVLSPGPGLPCESDGMIALINAYIEKKPILGVCLGFQAIVEHFGGSIYNQSEVKHGVAESCNFNNSSKLFKGLPERFKVGLYHSWAANNDNFPKELQVTSTTDQGIIMGFEHKTLPICGVQFHPESILTEHGKPIVNNFIRYFV